MSHHATEDLSILRALPGMVLSAPCSRWETREAVDALVRHDGPAYLRLERAGDFDDDSSVPFALGRARQLRDGTDLTLIGIGGIVGELVRAADQLRTEGITCRVLSLHTLKPLDGDALFAAAKQTGGILTVEENTVLGGLGGAVAETCLEHGVRPEKFRRLGVQDKYLSVVGDQAFLRSQTGIDRLAVIDAVRELLRT
jgi:transketolase